MLYRPTKQLLDIDEAWRLRWAEALMVSTQFKVGMCNTDDTAHCCLCVLERLHGRTFEDYSSAALPGLMRCSPTRTPCGQEPEGIRFAHLGWYNATAGPANLNDHHLTHKQIASLLRGEVVDTEDPQWDQTSHQEPA